jgi:Transcriptional regulator
MLLYERGDYMPPKIKTTQEDIILAAIHLTRNGGWDSVNARSLAKELGCSTQPIFRAFGSMEELKEMVYKRNGL